MAIVRFNGYPGAKPGHTYATRTVNPPPRAVEVSDDHGNPRVETIYGWDLGGTLTFDAAFAEAHGHAGTNDGEDFALLFITAENLGYEHADPKPFELVTAPPPVTAPPAVTVTNKSAAAGKGN